MIFDSAISKLIKKEDISPEEMSWSIEAVISGDLKTPDIESFLKLLREKGEAADEIAAAAAVMRRHAVKFSRQYPEALDTCGTGGDAKNTLNVSTLSALVACAAGVKVAKHGNRSVSGVCGSADLLEMLGMKIDLSAASAEKCLNQTGFSFLFAPLFHPAVKHATQARKNIQGKTLFNLLGPLTNPLGVKRQLLGVYSRELVEKMADVLRRLGLERALVVHGSDGLDEISISDSTYTAEIAGGKIKTSFLAPEAVELKRRDLSEIHCPAKSENLKKAHEVFQGVPGAALDIVCLNAAATLFIAEKSASVPEGFKLAKETISSGVAAKKLEEIVKFTKATA